MIKNVENFENIIKLIMTIFIGVILSIFISRQCLLQPNIINL